MMTEQLAEAGMLLGVGMTVVFAFLTLLIGGIHSIAWLSNLFPYPESTSRKNSRPTYKQNKKNDSTTTTVDPNIVAAISAAVNAHRRKS
ncbi:MAG: oxaloacetate decarboxylase gamma subunit [Alphaproteobacteria bacterium]|jgi:oxaloacetate decarboxylase gamma subunit